MSPLLSLSSFNNRRPCPSSFPITWKSVFCQNILEDLNRAKERRQYERAILDIIEIRPPRGKLDSDKKWHSNRLDSDKNTTDGQVKFGQKYHQWAS